MTTDELDAFWPKTEEELLEYIRERTAGIKDLYTQWEAGNKEAGSEAYNKAAVGMAKIAAAAFNYAAHIVGASVSQAGWASHEFWRLIWGREKPSEKSGEETG